MYQHDIKAKHLRDSLDDVVSSCVNYVGVDLNTASPALLKYVSGLNQLTAQRVFDYRSANGPFKSREDLKAVQGFGDATFVQAAGFLKIVGGGNPLDATWIHPESYAVATQILERTGATLTDLTDKDRAARLAARIAQIPLEQLAGQLGIGTLTLSDIIAQLTRPGRDPREALHPPIFKHGILKIDDLTPAMELQGTVLNVVDFGAFVDIGLKDSGLIHISQLANRYIQDPHEVVAVGDIVRVWVLGVDKDRRRVSLTMIAPGTPRQHEARRGDRGEGKSGGRPPRPARPPVRAGASAGSGGAPAGATSGGPPRTHEPRRGGGRPGRQAGKQGKPQVSSRPPVVQPKPKPRPSAPLSKDMIEGKAPLRTFGDLKQFWNIKQQEAEEEEKSADE
jgi:protein Tex